MKLLKGNVFTPVCQSFCSQAGGGVPAPVHGWIHQPPGQTPSPLARHPPPAHTILGRHHPPDRTATAADSTHPTGMHSCWVYYLILIAFYNGCLWDNIFWSIHQYIWHRNNTAQLYFVLWRTLSYIGNLPVDLGMPTINSTGIIPLEALRAHLPKRPHIYAKITSTFIWNII